MHAGLALGCDKGLTRHAGKIHWFVARIDWRERLELLTRWRCALSCTAGLTFSDVNSVTSPLDQRTRVMSCTQFVSQVLPSSGESACSQWHEVGVMLDQMKRARTRFPLTVSSP
jgi:hypothetical protein